MEWLGDIAEDGSVGLYKRQDNTPTRETLSRPQFLALVVLGDRRDAGWQNHPRLLRRSKNMDVGWQYVRMIDGADADNLGYRPCTRVVTPYSDLTL